MTKKTTTQTSGKEATPALPSDLAAMLRGAGRSELAAALNEAALAAGPRAPAKPLESAAERAAREAREAELAGGLGSRLAGARAAAERETKVPELLRRLGLPDTRASLESALAEAFAPHEGIVEKALERLAQQRGV